MTDKETIEIENMIYEIRGKQVMLDSDLAWLFDYETKNLNRQVQRNIKRFPEDFVPSGHFQTVHPESFPAFAGADWKDLPF